MEIQMKTESFLFRLLDKIGNLSSDALVALVFCCAFFFGSLTIVGGMTVSYFAPPDPNPPPHATPSSPAMSALNRELRATRDPEMLKYFSEKIMELEQRENSRRQIIINQVAPITSSN